MQILALDVAIGRVEAGVVETETGAAVGVLARAEFELDSPVPEAAEVPADRLWQAVTAAARQATLRAPDVQGVGLSVMNPALVLMDQNDRPCLPIWTPRDRRSRQMARQLWQSVGEEFLTDTGNRPLPGGMSALYFLQQLNEDPYLAHDVRSYLHLNGWLGFRMTGERSIDPANASLTGLFNTMADRNWSPRWCRHFQVEPDWLPPVRPGTTTVGHLRAGVAAELGVPAGIPVKLGSDDTTCAMLGAGLKSGDVLHHVNGSQTLAVLVEKAKPDGRRRCQLSGIGNQLIESVFNPVGGLALDWIRQLCFRDQGEEEFAGTVGLARERTTRVTLDPPFLAGDSLEIEARRGAFRDLELTTDPLDLLAALLEAMQRGHRQASSLLGIDSQSRVFLMGPKSDFIRSLIPDYQTLAVQIIPESNLVGVAKMFSPGGG